MVDRTFPQQARAAFGVLPYHTCERTCGAGGGVIRRAENCYRRDPERRRDMHRSRIVGEKKAACGGKIDKLAQGGLARKIPPAGNRCGDRFAERPLGGRSEDQHSQRRKCSRHFREAFGKPTLGVSISCARTDANCRAVNAECLHVLHARFPRLRDPIQADLLACGKALDQTRAPQQFEIVEALMPRDLAGLGNRDRAREQQPAAVATVADTLRDAGHPSDQRGIERVLQQNRTVEAFRAQSRGKRTACLAWICDYLIDARFARV